MLSDGPTPTERKPPARPKIRREVECPHCDTSLVVFFYERKVRCPRCNRDFKVKETNRGNRPGNDA